MMTEEKAEALCERVKGLERLLTRHLKIETDKPILDPCLIKVSFNSSIYYSVDIRSYKTRRLLTMCDSDKDWENRVITFVKGYINAVKDYM